MTMEEKGLGFIAIILVWGGLLYTLFYISPISANFSSGFLASAFSNFGNVLNSEQKEIIGIFDGRGNFQKASIHFDKSINIFDIKVSPDDPQLIFAGSDRGLFISRDGGLNWYGFSDVEHKIDSDTEVYKILFGPKSLNQAFISTFRNNKGIVYKSRNNFFSLEKIFEINGEAAYDFDVINSNLYLGLSDGRLLVYSLEKNDFRVLKTFTSAITNLRADSNGLIYLTLKKGGFWKSGELGQSFGQIEFLENYRGADKIQNFAIAASDNSLIYAATDYGLIRSLDSGNAWQVFKSIPTEEQKISALAFRNSPEEIYAASNGKIYESRDHGLNWRILELGFNNKEISIINLNSDRIIVGTRK